MYKQHPYHVNKPFPSKKNSERLLTRTKAENTAVSRNKQHYLLVMNWLTKTNAGVTKCRRAAPNANGLCPDVNAVCRMLWARFKM